ncbi:MAG: hypothetical protein GTN81_05265 [Proteobacteria bacterium]|nr:hypothetical protein [Pseudomonadota bacterium]
MIIYRSMIGRKRYDSWSHGIAGIVRVNAKERKSFDQKKLSIKTVYQIVEIKGVLAYS